MFSNCYHSHAEAKKKEKAFRDPTSVLDPNPQVLSAYYSLPDLEDRYLVECLPQARHCCAFYGTFLNY